MKKSKVALAFVVAALALVFVGAASGRQPMLKEGRTYRISSGTSEITGTVVFENGAGSFRVKLTDGREVTVNVAAVFWTEDVTK